MLKIKEKNIQYYLINIIEYLFIIMFTITNSTTMYGVMEEFIENGVNYALFSQWCFNAGMILLIVYILKYKQGLPFKKLLILAVTICFFQIYINYTNYNLTSFRKTFFEPFILFFLICSIRGAEETFRNLIGKYANVIFIIAVISLIFYFFGTLIPIIHGTPMRYYNNGEWNEGVNYYYLSFVNNWQYRTIFGIKLLRNVGIFMEAPGFAFPLCLALWWELFGKNKPSKLKCIIYVIVAVTTISMKSCIFAVIILALYILFKIFRVQKYIQKKPHICFIFGVAIIVICLLIVVFLKMGLFDKVSQLGSIEIRLQDEIGAFKTWLDYPWMGVGYYNLQEIYTHITPVRTTGDCTAGLFNILAYGGVYMFAGFVLSLVGVWKVAKRNHSKVFWGSILFIHVAFLFISASQYSFFTILISAMGISSLDSVLYKRKLKYKINN